MLYNKVKMPEDKRKIGRNEPCPCGSGKKYKHCCYPDKTRAWKTAGSHESPGFTVKPMETPKPILNHVVSSDGGKTWKAQPGLLAVRLYGKDPKNIGKTISGISKSVISKIDTMHPSSNVKQELVKYIHEVDHKLHAVKYHLNNYEQAESDKVKEFSENYKPPAGAQMVAEEPKLIYEIEAFLFQTKSCLDILSWVLKPTFGFPYCSFGEKGDDIIKPLRNNCPATYSTIAERLIELIEDAQDAWIVELIDMRDTITHYSRLEGFTCFIEDPHLGGTTANIHYPTMPNTRRALDYCQDVWKYAFDKCTSFSFAGYYESHSRRNQFAVYHLIYEHLSEKT